MLVIVMDVKVYTTENMGDQGISGTETSKTCETDDRRHSHHSPSRPDVRNTPTTSSPSHPGRLFPAPPIAAIPKPIPAGTATLPLAKPASGGATLGAAEV
jgi:hypothetical protein